ncbi:putative membrane protein [Acinetobacter sp. 1592897]|nr:putative membrane protein [Acinetobacter sp. 1592897]
MFFFRKKDLLFVEATYFVATFFCHYIFANLKKFYFLYGVNSGVSLQKTMLFFLPQNKFFSVFFIAFFLCIILS